MEKLKEWFFEPGPVKSPVMGLAGFAFTWSAAEFVLKAVVLVGTSALICIHLVNALVRQWCPLRRQKVSCCDGCPLKGRMLCPKGTAHGEEV